MSLLTLVNRFASEVNVDSNVTTVMGSTDPQVIQIKSLLQKEVGDLAGRGDWEALVNEATFTTGLKRPLTGTSTQVSPYKLIDGFANFIEDNVRVGETVTNTTTGETATITAIGSTFLPGHLTLSDDIFLGPDYPVTLEEYTIDMEDQGAIADLADNGFRYIRNDTIWDRDLRLPVYVIDATDWQQVKAVEVTGPRYQARIRGGRLLSNPPAAAGHTWAFEYVTWNAITDSTGDTQKQYFTNDEDLMLLPELLLESGLQWRWKKQKGMEYAEDFRTYEHLVANELSRNGLKRPLKMHQGSYTPEPKVFIPDGSWNV